MFATFNLDNFPFVNVNFAKNVVDKYDFDNFLKGWFALEMQQKQYTLIFDTTTVGKINPKYAFRLVSYIKQLKKLKQIYLTQSIIIVNYRWIRYLLDLVFAFEKPVAPIYIVDNHETSKILYQKLKNKEEITLKNITMVYP